jgi:hypothetical protein
MTTNPDDIVQFTEHPDAEALRAFDHPSQSLKRWFGVLTAKAWVGKDLACFFTEAEHGVERYVLIFPAGNGYTAGIYSYDMRAARIGSTFKIDVFVTAHFRPIIDRIEAVRSFA